MVKLCFDFRGKWLIVVLVIYLSDKDTFNKLEEAFFNVKLSISDE